MLTFRLIKIFIKYLKFLYFIFRDKEVLLVQLTHRLIKNAQNVIFSLSAAFYNSIEPINCDLSYLFLNVNLNYKLQIRTRKYQTWTIMAGFDQGD